MRQENRYLWREEKGEAVLYRVFGAEPVLRLPDQIGGYPLTVIGADCFSERNRVPEQGIMTESQTADGVQQGSWTEVAGGFLRQVILPDTIRRLDNTAFYNCRKLEQIEMGNGPLTIGSDVFMNCSRYGKTVVRGRSGKKSGVRQLLSRISRDMEIVFEDAVIFYPEYSESYDTIEPAHIFGLNIQGEGFRARQCFKQDVVDFSAYDDIFSKACSEEEPETLVKMALNRLMTPIGLSEQKKDEYETYVKRRAGEVFCVLVRRRDIDSLAFVCRNRYGDGGAVDEAAALAVRENWSEGAASLLEWKSKYFTVNKKKRYEF